MKRMQLFLACLALMSWPGIVLSATMQETLRIMENGASYIEERVGQGEIADQGDIVSIHFTLWLDDDGQAGRMIFDTRESSQPTSFRVGSTAFMPALSHGVVGMRQGGLRTLWAPPDIAYGHKGIPGTVPADARLLIEIELLALKK